MRGLRGCLHPGRYRAPAGSFFGWNRSDSLTSTSVEVLDEAVVTLVGHGGSERRDPASGHGCECADTHRKTHWRRSDACAVARQRSGDGGRASARRSATRGGSGTGCSGSSRRGLCGGRIGQSRRSPREYRAMSVQPRRQRNGLVHGARPWGCGAAWQQRHDLTSAQAGGGHGPSGGVVRDIERARGRGDAVRLWARGRLRRVTAPEGRARGREQSGRPHRLHEAALRHCEPRRPGGRWLDRLRPEGGAKVDPQFSLQVGLRLHGPGDRTREDRGQRASGATRQQRTSGNQRTARHGKRPRPSA